jgi:hypothetical protein
MKALSIRQPWAHWIVYGRSGRQKTIETRTWETAWRGDILIVASRLPDCSAADESEMEVMDFGKAIAAVELLDCRPMTPADEGAALCRMYPGAFSWLLGNVRRVQPFEVRGRLGLYEVPDSRIVYV